ncbi:hypothetical protein WBG78_29005 [Chryseolinea sp. T2]|uniref:hypothetical protein n=1 Tax=Chryseolinea sp. T2 TaxID=3129255 RepID=UPI003077BB98
MARVDKNSPFYGTSGRVGDLIFRTGLYGTTVHLAPEKKKNKSKYRANRNSRMPQAIEYARKRIRDPEMYELYQSGVNDAKNSAYMVAITDYLHAPKISRIDSSKYTGSVKQPINIYATDDFKVNKVMVVIRNPIGELVESGEATMKSKRYGRWTYLTTVVNTTTVGGTLLVTVEDHAENITSQTVVLGDNTAEQECGGQD